MYLYINFKGKPALRLQIIYNFKIKSKELPTIKLN